MHLLDSLHSYSAFVNAQLWKEWEAYGSHSSPCSWPSSSAPLPGFHGGSSFGYKSTCDLSASCWILALLCCRGVLAAKALNPFTSLWLRSHPYRKAIVFTSCVCLCCLEKQDKEQLLHEQAPSRVNAPNSLLLCAVG